MGGGQAGSPRSSRAWKVHGAKKTADTLWKTPEELGLKKLVGCVIFGAVTGEDLEKLKKTNESLVNGYGLKHSAEQQKWAYGKMTAYGSRIPKGGRRGNTYHAYTHILADTGNDLHTLFDLAKANHRYIRAIVETIDPDAAEAMCMNTGLDPMGTTMCNLHWDLDGLPEKNQTKKKTKTDTPEKTFKLPRNLLTVYQKLLVGRIQFLVYRMGYIGEDRTRVHMGIQCPGHAPSYASQTVFSAGREQQAHEL
ncbi:hypothetical protein B0H14DRAFT_2581124 [Mycena olivaceomarginata]|nr:hypothetical protein B0H14DRAFT_2581124 [Mycena olivaceomarginata]